MDREAIRERLGHLSAAISRQALTLDLPPPERAVAAMVQDLDKEGPKP